MSGARCWWCVKKNKSLHVTVGVADEPLGCCKPCHVLACGHHARRDPGTTQYICIVCDPHFVAASAALTSVTPNAALTVLAEWLNADPVWRDRPVESVSDFFSRTAAYEKWMEDRVTGYSWNPAAYRGPMRELLLPLTHEGRGLLLLAGTLVREFEISYEDLLPPLATVAQLIPFAEEGVR